MSASRIFIGLGSNLENPHRQVLDACAEIAALPGVELRAQSSLYRSAPVGYTEQPDFINAVAEIASVLAPLELLDLLQGVERRHGRIREFRNSPRTLDLDILIHGRLQLQHERLTLPHPGVHQRAFVLLPLLEIAPEVEIPGIGPARDWLAGCAGQGIERVVGEG